MRRLLTTTTLTLVLLLTLAVPAFAHASFDVKQVAAGATETYSLRVPLEREAGNQTIAVLVPAGWTVDDCVGAEGWSCEITVEDDGDSVVALDRVEDGAGSTERFSITLTAPDEAGIHRFPVVQGYDDGTEVAWIEEPGSDHPAPRIQVGDSDTVIERDETLPTHSGPTETASATAAPTEAATTAPAVTTTPSVSTDDASADDGRDDDDGVGLVPLLVGAVIAGVLGVLVARRRSA